MPNRAPKDLLFPLPDDLDFGDSPNAVAVLNDRLRRIGRTVKATVDSVATIVSGGSGSSAPEFTYYTKTLTANSASVALPGVAPGGFLAIVIYQDGVGGWIQTWQAQLVGMAGFIQTTTALTYTAALFYTPDGTNFLLLTPPITGVI